MNLLIIFAKNPETEPVKTRLAKDIGEKNAIKLYKNILSELVDEHKGQDYELKLYFKGDRNYFNDLNSKRQKGYELGEKIYNAFKSELKTHQKVIIIGSDLILDSKLVKDAFQSLDSADTVLGPAVDGGFYLIGMKELHNLFGNIPWSTPSVLYEILMQLKEKNLKICMLPKKRDIDTLEDLKHFERLNGS